MKAERIIAMARKEYFHILRDPFTLALALLLPVMMVTIFGFAIEFNVKEIKLAVHDGDRTQASRQLVETMASSNYFVPRPAADPFRAIQSIDSEKVRAAMIIDPKFEYALKAGRGAQVQIIIDGSDNSTIGSVLGYLQGMQDLATQRIVGIRVAPPIEIKSRYLYNPELNSRWFVIPGLSVIVVGILSILLTALTVAREWENGSMELLLSTPVEPIEIILGKLAPYVVLGLSANGFVYLIARLVFGVPFHGSHWVFLFACILFLITYLAQGLLISVATRKQVLAMQLSMMSGLLPVQLLSGFIFPVESMPLGFQLLTCILPARWFMVISRDVFLKGSGPAELRTPLLALGIICFLMVMVASKRFKRDVEP